MTGSYLHVVYWWNFIHIDQIQVQKQSELLTKNWLKLQQTTDKSLLDE